MSLQLTQEERAYILNEYDEAEARLKQAFDNITDDQFNFQPSDAWSIAQCTEHIITFNQNIFGVIIKKAENIRDTVPETQHSKEKLVAIMQKRRSDYKVQAPENFVPTGLYNDKSTAFAQFQKDLNTARAFVKTSDVPLRKIAFKHMILGLIDAIGWLAIIGGHSKRHISQIEEVMQREDFPK